jgi:hypothetical protein
LVVDRQNDQEGNAGRVKNAVLFGVTSFTKRYDLSDCKLKSSVWKSPNRGKPSTADADKTDPRSLAIE